MKMLSVVEELGADKAPEILGRTLQLSLQQGEELEIMKDCNCQAGTSLSVPGVDCGINKRLLFQESGLPRVESVARWLLEPHPGLPC